MATTSTSLPQDQQQQQDQAVPNADESVPNSTWHYSSGSIGPFFAVISVLAVLAILSCILGRICSRRSSRPLENINNRGLFGWVKRKWGKCIGCGHVEVRDSCKAQDGVTV